MDRHRKSKCNFCDKEFRSDNLKRHKTTCKKNPAVIEKKKNEQNKEKEPRQRKGINFFLTFQRYTKYQIARKIEYLKKKEFITGACIGNENGIGIVPNQHSHAVIVTKEKMNFEQFKNFWILYKLPMYADVQSVKNMKTSIKYITKEDYRAFITGIDKDFTSLIFKAYIEAMKSKRLNCTRYPYCNLIPSQQKQFAEFFNKFRDEIFEEEMTDKWDHIELKDWQQRVINSLERQNERRILWIYDEIGGQGKTTLAKYLLHKKGAFYMTNCPKKDMAFAYNRQEYVCVDYSRDTAEHVNYANLEYLKNGVIFSSKYESQVKQFHIPKIVCFSNFLPDKTKLSRDRWIVSQLENGELTRLRHFNQ